MSWITIIWSMDSAFCFVLAGIYLLVSLKQREWREHLLFSCSALAAGVVAGFELAVIRAETVTQYGALMRWAQLPLWIVLVSLVWFVHLYLRAGRRWLVWTFCGLRTLLLAANFLSKTNVVYREITSLRHFSWWGGETVSAPVGVPNPWVLVGQLSLLLLLIFFLDVTITVWRRGDRRRALMVGGSAVFFLTLLLGESALVTWVIKSPFLISFAYLGIIATMGYELSDNLLRAAHLAKQFQASEAALRESEARIKLAANAANLGLWVWDIRNDEFLVTEKWRRLFGFAESEPVNFGRWLQLVHPEDRERMKQTVQDMLEHGGGERESEYRITQSDGSTRWIAGYGGVELDEGGKPAFTRGVSRDITKSKVAEEELRESEARFRVVADAAPVLIWMSGTDKLCTFFNKTWLEFTGRTMEQEMGNGWAEGVHPDDFQRCLQTYVAAFDARQPFVMQYRLRRHDGEYRWISDNGVPRYDAQKNFAGYIGSCMDVTELVNKEQALRDSEERMSLAADAAGLIVWTWDIRRDEVSLSDKDRAFFGFSQREKLNGDRVRSVVHSEDRQFVRQLVENSLHTREDIEAEYRVVLSDGKVRWVTRRGRVEFDGNGEPICERGVLMDITERKQAEEKFRLVVEASPSGIILVDKEGRVALVNSQTEKLFGYGREELLGKPVEILVPEWLASQHPDHRAEFLAAPTSRAMGAGRELFARRKDGTEFPVEIGLNPIQAPDGILVLAVVLDISARKLAEAEAVRHREELGHLSRVAVTGELAASIAHELNQPLSAIISNASAGQRFIEGGRVDLREIGDLLADIVADGRRAGDVIRGIQNMVRKRTPARQRVNLNDLVTNVVRMVNANAILHSCEVETLLDTNLPAIEADPIQLQQVLLNLMINAFEAMGNTPISRRKVVIATERNGDGAISASVRDYGVGIPEEARERLFDHFFTTKAEGLGMGLAIVRSILESHAGTVAVENAKGGGACFRFTVPASAAAL